MPTPVIPSDTHAVNDTGHTTAHNNISDMLGLITQVLAQMTGTDTAYPGGNTSNIAALTAFLSTPLMVAAATATDGVFQLVDGTTYVLPNSVFSGSTNDSARINAAAAIGDVRLGPYTYNLHSTTTGNPSVDLPYNIRLIGQPLTTVLAYTGSGIAVRVQGTTNPPTIMRVEGAIDGVVIDVSGASGGAIGLFLNDLNGYSINCGVKGATTQPGVPIPTSRTGAYLSLSSFSSTVIGVYVSNTTFSLNHLYGYCHIQDCGNGLVFDSISETDIEHLHVAWSIHTSDGTGATGGTGQNSVMLLGSSGNICTLLACSFDCAIAMTQYSQCAIYLNPGANFVQNHVRVRMEAGGAPSTGQSIFFGSTGSGFQNCTGILFIDPSYANSNIGSGATVATMKFGGMVQAASDSALTSAIVAPLGWA